jgi:hypothetical protein
MEMLPGLYSGHLRQDALQDALDEKAGNIWALVPFWFEGLFPCAPLPPVKPYFDPGHGILPNHFNSL